MLLPKNKYLAVGLGVGILVVALFVGPRLLKKKSAPIVMPSVPAASTVAPAAPISPVSVGTLPGVGAVEAGNPFYTAQGQTDMNETSTIARYNPVGGFRARAYRSTSPYRQNRISI